MSWRQLLSSIHRDERGAVSLETVLIIGAVALPILIFILKFGWPRIRDLFLSRQHTLESEADHIIGGGSR